MKKLFLLGIGSALIFTIGGVGPAQADGGKHISSAAPESATAFLVNTAGGRCAACHRAHTSKAEYLLKVAQPQLCYSCHGAGGPGSSTDVVNGNDTASGALRAGGFANAQIGSDAATKDTGTVDPANGRMATSNQTIPALTVGRVTTSKHLIDGVTAGTAWGNGTDASGAGKSLTLECGSCHDPHGNKNYRILRPIPVDSGYAVHVIRPARAFVAAKTNATTGVVTPAIPAVAEILSSAKGINIPDVPTGVGRVYTTINYWLAGDTTVAADPNAAYTGELTGASAGTGGTPPDGYIANIANWCTTCHTRYLATTGSYKTPLASATAGQVDGNFTYRHRSDANYKLGAANCITCHVSHGSNATVNGSALKVANPGAATDANGDATTTQLPDSKLLRVDNRGTCALCHNV